MHQNVVKCGSHKILMPVTLQMFSKNYLKNENNGYVKLAPAFKLYPSVGRNIYIFLQNLSFMVPLCSILFGEFTPKFQCTDQVQFVIIIQISGHSFCTFRYHGISIGNDRPQPVILGDRKGRK